METIYSGKPKRFIAAVFLAVLITSAPVRAGAQENAPVSIPVSKMNAEQLEARGDAFRSQKDPASALDAYMKAISKSPKDAVLWNKAGMTQLLLGAGSQGAERTRRYEEARRDFERAVKLKKNYAVAWNNIGVVYFQQEDYRKAISNYNKAIAIESTAAFHSNLGSAYFAVKKFDDAMKQYLEAVRLDPEVFERSSANGLSGRVSTPDDRAKYAIMLAKLYAKMGDVDHSLIQIRRALENGYSELQPLYDDAVFAEVRKDPRFAELMQNKPTALPE